MPIYDLNVPRTMTAFNKKVASKPETIIVLFYMDMCPHCIMMKPAWRAAKMAIDPKLVNIAEVEYSNLEKMPKEMQDIRGFPSIKVYRGAKTVDEYLGERTPEGFMSFMQKYSAPPAPPSAPKATAASRSRPTSTKAPSAPRAPPTRSTSKK